MSKPTLVIGNRNYSSWSYRAWLILTKANIEFDTVRIPLFVDGFQDEIAKFSPAGKVPIYIDDDLTIWDSLSIAEYIAETHSELWPSQEQARATARTISAEMHAGFSAVRNAMPMNCRATGRKVKITSEVNAEVSRIQTSLDRVLTTYGNSGSWLFGCFTIADAMYAPIISRFITYGVPMVPTVETYAQMLQSDPYVTAWYADACQESEVIVVAELGHS